MIEAEHSQADRMRRAAPTDDFWQPFAQQFRADPRRTDDPLLNRLLQEVHPQHTVLDVGAGGGRMALPVALHCRHVVAVEPSDSLASVLRQQADRYGIQNISVVHASWADATVDPADLVLCAHVLYTIREIEFFVRKLEARAREGVLVVLYHAPPQSQIYPLWRQIHGEERLPLPSLSEFQAVLGELSIAARIDMLPPQVPRGFDSIQQATDQLSRRLYLPLGSDQYRTLERILPDLLEKGDDGIFRIRGARPLEPALVWWDPRIGS